MGKKNVEAEAEANEQDYEDDRNLQEGEVRITSLKIMM